MASSRSPRRGPAEAGTPSDRQVGGLALDAAGRMKPAWLLRNEFERKMIKEGDVRLKAHAEILPTTFEIILMHRKLAAAGIAGVAADALPRPR